MNRLHKKCFVASMAMHLLLAALLFIAPAFLSSKPESDNSPILHFVPDTLVDEDLTNLGAGAAATPPADPAPITDQSSAPLPTPPPQPAVTPISSQPKPEPVESKPEAKKKEDTPALKPTPQEKRPVVDKTLPAETKLKEKPLPPSPKKPEIKLNTGKVVKRYPADAAADRAKAQAKVQAEAEQQAKKAAEQYRSRVLGSLTNIAKNAAAKTDLTGVTVGGGGVGGEVYASYKHVVYSVYVRAWIAPEELNDDSASVEAKVTIARNGSVVREGTFVQRRSGISALDKSVQEALDRVRSVAPFPESSKDTQRTFTIIFNLKAKRVSG